MRQLRMNWRGRMIFAKGRLPKPEDNKPSWADWFYADYQRRKYLKRNPPVGCLNGFPNHFDHTSRGFLPK